jgi:ribonuclease HII
MKNRKMKIAGIDEAGRGSVIGPIVIAGVLLDERGLSDLSTIDIKDSKLLSPRRREWFFNRIENLALNRCLMHISTREIDKVVKYGKRHYKLNWLEAKSMAKLITILEPDVVFVDASDVSPDRFKQNIKKNTSFEVKIISEHKADIKYPVVSAASIVAKVERDRIINELRNRHGHLGSGYPSDPKTIRFLKNWKKTAESYPDFVRKSWKTLQRIDNEGNKKKKKLNGTSLN